MTQAELTDELLVLWREFRADTIVHNRNYTDGDFSFEKFMRWLENN